MNNLTIIPGVGKIIAKDLELLNIHKVEDLKDKNPEKLYKELCNIQGKVDRCMLYVFRCAVYFANNKVHEPKLLKWWNWKDKERVNLAAI